MFLINNESLDPYFNHALEEYFLKTSEQEYFILWRSSPCILIGKNQNAYREINIDYVKANNLPIVRRLSGGGAIFNDLGNILFGFISNGTKDIFGDFQRFTKPILEALKLLGIDAELSGRNDLIINDKKFSGNAQARHKSRILHHGSILYSSNMSDLTSALNVNPIKFTDKAVKSVGSRVTNVSEHMSKPIDVKAFMAYLFNYILETNSNCSLYQLTSKDIEGIHKIRDEKTSTWEWNFGHSPKYSLTNEKKFPGGIIELHMNIENGIIENVKFYGDFFSESEISELEISLKHIKYKEESVRNILEQQNIDKYIKNISIDNMIELMFHI